MTTEMRFAAAIDLTQAFLGQLAAAQLTPAQITSFVADLVASQEGARGFFVGYLTSPEAIADHPDPAILQGLATNPPLVTDLLIKNLAMSTAQQCHFQRDGQSEMAAHSQKVAERSRQLITRLQWPELFQHCAQLSESATTGLGQYGEFLQRWGYDQEQKQAIQRVMSTIVE